MTRGRSGLNVAIREFQDASQLTINWCGNIRPNARASFQPSVSGKMAGHESLAKQEGVPPPHVRTDRRDGGADILGSGPGVTPPARKWARTNRRRQEQPNRLRKHCRIGGNCKTLNRTVAASATGAVTVGRPNSACRGGRDSTVFCNCLIGQPTRKSGNLALTA